MVMSAKPGWRLRKNVTASGRPLFPTAKTTVNEELNMFTTLAVVPKGLAGEDSAFFAHQLPPIGSQPRVAQILEDRVQTGI
jgi:hypothetical protein